MFKFLQKKKKPFVTVVIAAGGTSSRMNGENKLLLELKGMPVLAHSMLAFEKCDDIDEIIVSAHEENMQLYADIAEKYSVSKLSKIVKGGDSRLQSVYNAAINVSENTGIILVHDAARPLVDIQDIKKIVADTVKYGSAAASNKMTDTVKRVKGGVAVETLDRNVLYTVQTPQGSDKDVLVAALQKAVKSNDLSVTDECSALEKLGVMPYMSETSRNNIKLTYPEDIALAEAILNRRDAQCE